MVFPKLTKESPYITQGVSFALENHKKGVLSKKTPKWLRLTQKLCQTDPNHKELCLLPRGDGGNPGRSNQTKGTSKNRAPCCRYPQPIDSNPVEIQRGGYILTCVRCSSQRLCYICYGLRADELRCIHVRCVQVWSIRDPQRLQPALHLPHFLRGLARNWPESQDFLFTTKICELQGVL